jgi:hypothetical protein
VNLRHILSGMLFGTVIALGLYLGSRATKLNLTPAPSTLSSITARIEARTKELEEERDKHFKDQLQHQNANDAWLKRRSVEFDKCAELNGTPTLGFGMRVVCLDSRFVTFMGEQHPPE